MTKSFKTVMTAILLLGASSVHAGGFVGFGGALVDFDDGFDSVKPKNVLLRVGYACNYYFEVGGELGVTLLSDEISGVDFDVDTTFLYVQGNIPVGNGSKIFVMAGSTDVELTGTLSGFSASVDDSDTGLGFGIQIPASSQDAYYSFDYIKYFDDDGVDVTGINFSYMGYF